MLDINLFPLSPDVFGANMSRWKEKKALRQVRWHQAVWHQVG